MKIAKLDTFIARIPYKRWRQLFINRGGSDVIVKLTTEDGLVGWGECTRAADTSGIESAVKAMAPLVIGRSIWDTEVIQRDLAIHAVWAFQPMTGNFAYAGIDMALMDLCGKQVVSRSIACSAAPCAMRSTISTIWSGERRTASQPRQRTACGAVTRSITSRSGWMRIAKKRCSKRSATRSGRPARSGSM